MKQVTVEQAEDGTWRVQRDGVVMADGLTNAAAWAMADRLDEADRRMEAARREISISAGKW